MKQLLVSAIITTYKREPSMVCRAVSSIMEQTYRPMEIIVVDDSPGSFSLREEVRLSVEKMCPTVRYICHENNQGACAARNTGLQAANGDYIAFLDDDDEWLPEKISRQMEVMHTSDAKLVYCSCICQNDTTGRSAIRKTKFCRGDVFHELLYGNFIDSTSFPLIEAKALRSVGGFDTQMQSAQDFDVWLRLAQRYRVDYVTEPLVIYHEHEGEQITSNPQKKIAGLERINDKYAHWIDADPKLWYQRHKILLPYYAMNGMVDKAWSVWWQCVKHDWYGWKGHVHNLGVILKYSMCKRG